MDKLVDGIVLDRRESEGYVEDFDSVEVTVDSVKVAALMDYTEDMEDIDPNYPTTDELDDMDSFLTHYKAFVDKVDGCLSGSNTIALYAVYMHCNYGKVRRFLHCNYGKVRRFL